MKYLFVLCCIFVCSIVSAQSHQLIVTVYNDDNSPVPNAPIALQNGETALSDANGRHIFVDMPPGVYQVKVSLTGHKPVTRAAIIKKGDVSLIVRLHPQSHTLQEVLVEGQTLTKRKREAALNTEIIKSDFIQQHLGGSLMQSLQRVPGVKTIGIGSGQSKPLIRGLGFNRVVVLDKGVKHEGQQWGADHGLEIDQFAVEEVEILKGAASFAYGSDAIAGAVNIKRPALPAIGSFGGAIMLLGKSNNAQLGTSVNLYRRTAKWITSARFTLQDYGDYRVPADSLYIYDFAVGLHKNYLRNTAGRETGLHLSAGYLGEGLKSTFYISNTYTKSGFFANAHGLEPRQVNAALHDQSSRDILAPFQKVNHFKVLNHSTIQFNNHKAEIEAGYQHNIREEYNNYVNHGYMPAIYPPSMTIARTLERAFDKQVYSLNIKDHFSLGNHELQVGMNSEIQNNTINGWSFLVPAFDQHSVGAFVYDKLRVNERLLLHGALRYDHNALSIHQYTDWFPSENVENGQATNNYIIRAAPTQRRFNSVTGSIGFNYNLPVWAFRGNIGKSFRAPIAKELSANGVNYHYFSYEKGNPSLSPEESYQADLGINLHKERLNIVLTPFFNYFPNYIYLNPTADHDYFYGAGNQVFEYAQARVGRYGGELQVKYQFWENLSAEVIGEYLYAEQLSGDKKGYTLPFSPPASALFNITYRPVHTGMFTNTYFSADYRVTAAQNNIVPPEKPTAAYNIVNVQAGTSFSVNGQLLQLNLQAQNLFNTRYLNHTSFYRLIGLPEQGRNLVLSVKIPFSFSAHAFRNNQSSL